MVTGVVVVVVLKHLSLCVCVCVCVCVCEREREREREESIQSKSARRVAQSADFSGKQVTPFLQKKRVREDSRCS